MTLPVLLALVSVASAADWPLIQGTEQGQADQPVRPFGFVQVVGEEVFAEPVHGLRSSALAPFDGQVPQFDRLGSGDAVVGLSARRARLGFRGSVPQTAQRVAWLLSLEAGTSAVTRTAPVVLSDGSVTFSPVPAVNLRVGRFKLPLGDEALESNPVAATSIDASAATQQLLLENPVSAGAYTGGSSGFRDLGVSAFGTVDLGPVAVSWDGMVSNGGPGAIDATTDKDLTGRVTVAHVLSGAATDPHRHEVAVSAWVQRGGRVLDSEPGTRLREGIGVHLETAPVRARAELIRGVGMIETGAEPPFPGQPVQVLVDGRALGGYAVVHGAWRGGRGHRALGRAVAWDRRSGVAAGVRDLDLRRRRRDRASGADPRRLRAPGSVGAGRWARRPADRGVDGGPGGSAGRGRVLTGRAQRKVAVSSRSSCTNFTFVGIFTLGSVSASATKSIGTAPFFARRNAVSA